MITAILASVIPAVYVILGMVAARIQYLKMYRSGDWRSSYDCVDRFLPVMGSFLFWPIAFVYFAVTLPPKEERALKLQKRIAELEMELRL